MYTFDGEYEIFKFVLKNKKFKIKIGPITPHCDFSCYKCGRIFSYFHKLRNGYEFDTQFFSKHLPLFLCSKEHWCFPKKER